MSLYLPILQMVENRSAHSFKKTESMSALLEERSRRQGGRAEASASGSVSSRKSLESLVENVKRKSDAIGEDNSGKRRKLAPK